MARARARRLAGGLVLAAACCCALAGAEVPGDQEPLAAGQLLVRFARDAPIDARIGAALQASDGGAAEIDAFVQTLSRSLDLPLFNRRLTAGRELLLELERAAMLEAVAVRLAADHAVIGASVVVEAGTLYWSDYVRVKLAPGSELHRQLGRIEPGGGDAPALAPALARLAPHPFKVLRASVLPQRELAVRIDLRATTLALVRALAARADVAYAQPNFTATIN